MDHRGRVLDWNHAAEATFGYRAHEAIGNDMADLVVPPQSTTVPSQGLARFLETEHAVILDKRLELAAMHKNGAEFPVELTITRIGLPGQPTFTGYLRDITDRIRAESELRASRARLVEVADAERRRIQRNLHDGAQQRLTSVLLTLGRVRSQRESTVTESCSIRPSTSWRAALTSCARSRAGCIPPCSASAGLPLRSRRSRCALPFPCSSPRCPTGSCPEAIEAAAYYVARRRSPTCRSTRARAGRRQRDLRRQPSARRDRRRRRRRSRSGGRRTARARRPRRGAGRDGRGGQPGGAGHARARPLPARLRLRRTRSSRRSIARRRGETRGPAAAALSVFRRLSERPRSPACRVGSRRRRSARPRA